MNTVLVATERDLEQNLLAQALDGQADHIIRSRDGLDALEMARSKAPQVLLVNVSLPKLDGFALFRRFQQDEQLRNIPFVLFSTRSNDQKSERFAIELGAARFVGNALRPGALAGVIQEVLAATPTPLPAFIASKKPAAENVVPRPVKNEAKPAVVAPALEVISNATIQRANGNQLHAVAANDASVIAHAAVDRTEKLPVLIAVPDALPDTLQLDQLREEQAQLNEQLLTTQRQLTDAQAWHEVFGLSPVAMWLTDKNNHTILAVNDAALRLFGYGQAEFMQLDSAVLLRDQTNMNATGVSALRTKDGRALSLLTQSRDLMFQSRAAELCIAHDVSYRVRGERAMADEVQRIKMLLAALPVAYWVIDAQAQLQDANAVCCKLLGLSREQLVNHDIAAWLGDAQQASTLLALEPGQTLTLSLRGGDGAQRNIEFTAGQTEFGAGLRLLTLQAEHAPVTVQLPALVVDSKLPAVLEMIRYAEDADESTLLQYAMAQLANAFDSPVALFATLERVTQTLDVCAINHAQAARRGNTNRNIVVPEPWRALLKPHTVCSNHVPDEALLLDGLPEISSYMACSAAHGRELWMLLVANRDTVYSAREQRELQECADILVALLARKRQQFKLQSMAQRSAANTESMLGLLEKLLDQHDGYAAGSGHRIAALVMNIGRQLSLSAEQQTTLSLAARLHDIGHLMLPQSLLLQPTAYTVAEAALVHTHVERGVQLLRSVDLGSDVASIVAQHHERLDGSGYPAALQGDQISIEARILAVADVVDAMSSARAYRPALSITAALEALRAGAGRCYDAEVVAACERAFAANEGRWPV